MVTSTRDIVLILPVRAFAQANDETWYVLVSRARHRVVAFTDCKEALHEQVMIDGDRKSVWEHERDEAKRKEQERARAEESPRQVDLQRDAIKAPTKEVPVEHVAEGRRAEYERSLWERAAAKYPVETRTPELQKQIERTITRMVREHEGHEAGQPTAGHTVNRYAAPPPERSQRHDRGLSRGF